MARQLNYASENLIKSFETLRLAAYDDKTSRQLPLGATPAGIPTIGWGHTKGVKPGDSCTREQADTWFKEDIAEACADVERLVKVGLTDNQYGALVCFVFNTGGSEFATSTLLKMLNAGNYDAVPGQLMRWNKYRGQALAGLTRRRTAECSLFIAPEPGFQPPPMAADTASASADVDHPHGHHAATLSGISLSAFASAANDISQQLQLLAEYADTLRYLCTALTFLGAGIAIYYRLKTLKTEGA